MSSSVTDAKELIIISLTKFYNIKQNLKILLDHIEPTTNTKEKTSLRVIDWFVTNFAKKKTIIISTSREKYFNVYVNYRSQLKAYSKHQFDPFRRRFRINYYYDKEKFVETTIGQLNFFKWLIENDILKYIQEHHDEVESDMMKAQKVLKEGGGGSDGVVKNESNSTLTDAKEVSEDHRQRMSRMDGNRLLSFV